MPTWCHNPTRHLSFSSCQRLCDFEGLGAPKATPAEIVDRLNKEVNSALDDPKMKARIADETEKGGKVIKFAGIKPE